MPKVRDATARKGSLEREDITTPRGIYVRRPFLEDQYDESSTGR